MRKNRGFMLMTLYLLIPLLLILTGALMAQTWTDLRASQRSQASLQGLYCAEAGIDSALVQLRQNYSWQGGSGAVGNIGNYSVTVGDIGQSRLQVVSTGVCTTLSGPVTRSVEITVQKAIPPDFYDHVIWASKNLDFRGSAYEITGGILHGDTTPTSNTSHVTGSITYNAKANPLPRLNYQQLHDIAASQGNVYDAARLGNGHGVFPTSFWYQQPTNPADPSTGIPNVNYITTDLILNGNIGTLGGLFVVVGNVLTDPTMVEDTTINGNGQIKGAIYSTGNFRINGGGGNLNIDGGVWAGNEVRVNGNSTLTYNAQYMQAIKALGIKSDVTVLSWREPE